ncbi:hypothetical protein B0H10DRAFT_2214030 [Mycena sp. CBHHK59/15]|nr:hypothetical protein B0H10DRAFT_2214030 [Mycena sp. CBHHK59/15]
MLVSPSLRNPCPKESSSVPHRSSVERHTVRRDAVADQGGVDDAKTRCEIFSGNDVLSCFPTADTIIPQHELATFVWNSNVPDFTQTDRVDIYLFHGDSLQQILFFGDQINPRGAAGVITTQVNDSWWGGRGANWAGSNISYPFYWIISRANVSLTEGTQKPQTTFSAVQTTFADSVIASMSSASAARLSTTTVITSSGQAVSGSVTATVTVGDPGKLQSGRGTSGFPHWAIVVIVLGIIAVVTACACVFFILQHIHRRNTREAGRQPLSPGSPPMAYRDEPAPAAAPAASSTSHRHDASRGLSPDSTISRGGDGPFSGADAAVMANAFRTALRAPGLAGHPLDEGENPQEEGDRLVRRELSDEGTDIRSVESVRGVRVESSSEGGDMARDSARFSPHRELSI